MDAPQEVYAGPTPARFTMRSDGPVSCGTCAHSIGWCEHHTFCLLHERVHVYPCAHWERGAGCDRPE
jgi:hypothetical protein